MSHWKGYSPDNVLASDAGVDDDGPQSAATSGALPKALERLAAEADGKAIVVGFGPALVAALGAVVADISDPN